MDQNLRTQLQYDAQKKSTAAAYILWLFLGGFGVHRFYLGHMASGFGQLALCLLGVVTAGAAWAILGLWWLIDAALIPGMVQKRNLDVLERLQTDPALFA